MLNKYLFVQRSLLIGYLILVSNVIFAEQPKQRIVSMNLCIDQLLWQYHVDLENNLYLCQNQNTH